MVLHHADCPPGTFTYGFYVNCTSPPPTLTGCTELSDPSNPPWNHSGSVEPDSEVYVPSDPRFGTADMSWQAPNRRFHGTLLDVSYPDPQSTEPVGSHPLAVYLPPGYDPHRAHPVPDAVPQPWRWRQRGGLDDPGCREQHRSTT